MILFNIYFSVLNKTAEYELICFKGGCLRIPGNMWFKYFISLNGASFFLSFNSKVLHRLGPSILKVPLIILSFIFCNSLNRIQNKKNLISVH